jgi:hypothetical protein
MLHGIEAHCATGQAVANAGSHVLGLEHLHQTQHLPELTLALSAHAGFEQSAQRCERLGQRPTSQRRCLVERVGLLFDECQVVQRIEHEVLALIGARVSCDDLRPARDHHLMHVATDQHLLVAVGRWNRVVVASIANQRQ